MSDTLIDKLIAEADFNRDGRISYEEFLQVFSQQKHETIYAIYEDTESDRGRTKSNLSTDEVLKTRSHVKFQQMCQLSFKSCGFSADGR
jgi:hypothetical protein